MTTLIELQKALETLESAGFAAIPVTQAPMREKIAARAQAREEIVRASGLTVDGARAIEARARALLRRMTPVEAKKSLRVTLRDTGFTPAQARAIAAEVVIGLTR